MNGDTSGKTLKAEPSTDWQRLRDMTDAEVHQAVVADPDAIPTDEGFWEAARVVRPGETKTRAQRQQDVENYIAARKWYRERVQQGKATDDDLQKLERCRDLAVEARRSGVTAPAFE